MRLVHLLCAACIALSSSNAVHAQARARAPTAPDIVRNERAQGSAGFEEVLGENPCPRIRTMGGKPSEAWQRMAWAAFCIERVRLGAVSRAWDGGLDEHGTRLDAGAHARKLAETEAWLRSLVGRFRVDGEYWNSGGRSPVRGTADCVGVGDGPGVACVMTASWKAPREVRKDKGLDDALNNALQPLFLLFGVDPEMPHLRVALVDFRAVEMQGLLADGAVLLTGRHDEPLTSYSWMYSLMAMRPGGVVDMKFLAVPHDPMLMLQQAYIQLDLRLHREPPGNAARPPASP